uniref:Transposase n=1 Tax=Steinernema glaseri TaxID=37863 RepID=A0A1I7ZEZ9_9BILA
MHLPEKAMSRYGSGECRRTEKSHRSELTVASVRAYKRFFEAHIPMIRWKKTVETLHVTEILRVFNVCWQVEQRYPTSFKRVYFSRARLLLHVPTSPFAPNQWLCGWSHRVRQKFSSDDGHMLFSGMPLHSKSTIDAPCQASVSQS